MNKREEIPKILKNLVFLSQDRRQYLLDNYTSISDEKIEKIYDFLDKAIFEQNSFIDEEIKKNPLLLGQAKVDILKRSIKNIHQMEVISNAQEFKEIESLELEISNI